MVINFDTQKTLSKFLFLVVFQQKYVEVVINDFTMHVIISKWLRIQKTKTEEKSNETKRSKQKKKLLVKVFSFILLRNISREYSLIL